MEYILHILILICIYSIVSISLDLMVGYTGLLSVANAAFYGIGAYATALLTLKAGVSFWLAVPAGMLAAGMAGYLIALSSLKTHDDYFVITTFAFQVIVFSILNNWVSFTGGPLGLPGIPRPSFFGMPISSHVAFLGVTLVAAAGVFFAVRQIANSPFGLVLKAIREDEVFAESMGKDVMGHKVAVFVLSSSISAIGGGLYAAYISYIDPTSFTVMESIFMISIVIIGGAGSIRGPIVGAALLVSLPEALRFVGMPNSIAANMRQIFYGLLLVAFMMFRPQGIMGRYGFGRASGASGEKTDA